MMGTKARLFQSVSAISLDELVPADHFYRHVDRVLDLCFVRELVRDRSVVDQGRTSVDPVVFFRLQLVMFFEDIRSERQLLRLAADQLSVRGFLEYNLDEALPDHSTLTRIRARYGLEVFRRFFEAIVEQCQQAGLIWSKELYFDATQVQADAALDSLVARLAVEARQAWQPHHEREAQQADGGRGHTRKPGRDDEEREASGEPHPAGGARDPTKSGGLLRHGSAGDRLAPVSTYKFVAGETACHSVVRRGRALGVSPSGYWAWQDRRKRGPSALAQADAHLVEQSRAIHQASRGTYGVPRIHAELATMRMHCGCKRVARLMRQTGLVGCHPRRPCHTTRRDVFRGPSRPRIWFSARSPPAHRTSSGWLISPPSRRCGRAFAPCP